LKGIVLRDQEVFIGATTTLTDLLASPIIREHFTALHQAIEAVAAPPVRNVATLGGNLGQNTRCLYYNQSKAWRLERPPCFKAGGSLCHVVPKGKKCFSVYCGDLAPALMALEGRLSIQRKNQSTIIPLQDLFTGNALAPFNLAKDSLITGVILRLPGQRGASNYQKMRLRSAVDYPLLSAAASLTLQKGWKIKKATLILGAVGPSPVIVETDQLFPGGQPDLIDQEALSEILRKKVQLVDNLALPGSYRKKILPVVVEKAIRGALEAIPQKE
jgi:4-hydroxybenzoyl-CoA reductase subunit beta